MKSERAAAIVRAIRTALAGLDFHPTDRELFVAFGALLVEWGEYLYRRRFPGHDPKDLETVELHHYQYQDSSCAMILQGHLMQIWGENDASRTDVAET